MSKKTFSFQVINNKIVLDNPKGLNQAIIDLNGQKGKLTIAKYTSSRTLSQNALYWKWLEIIGEHIGHSKEDTHIVFKKQFLKDKMPALSKDVFLAYLQAQDLEDSTKALDTKQMKIYMDQVYDQAKELDITLPLPEDQYRTEE